MATAAISRVLTFHGVGKTPRSMAPGEEQVWLEREQFARILDAAAGRADVALTFDDGNLSDLEEAAPILRERGLTATFFVCAGRLGEPDFLAPGDVRELLDAGMNLGSHGWAHQSWRGMSDSSLQIELRDARKRLEDVAGRPIETASCPFGAYDRRVLAALRAAGYSRVFTSDGGPARADDWLVPRITVLRHYEVADVLSLIDRPLSLPARLGRALRLAVKRWR